ADEIIFATEGELEGDGMSTETLANGADDVVKIRAHAVHLVHETNARDAILVGLAPNGFRLRLHAGDRVKHANRAVEHAQGAFDFDSEVHVPRRIDDVDAILFVEAVPRSSRRRGRNRDAAFAFLLHPVHRGSAFVHGTD